MEGDLNRGPGSWGKAQAQSTTRRPQHHSRTIIAKTTSANSPAAFLVRFLAAQKMNKTGPEIYIEPGENVCPYQDEEPVQTKEMGKQN